MSEKSVGQLRGLHCGLQACFWNSFATVAITPFKHHLDFKPQQDFSFQPSVDPHIWITAQRTQLRTTRELRQLGTSNKFFSPKACVQLTVLVQ